MGGIGKLFGIGGGQGPQADGSIVDDWGMGSAATDAGGWGGEGLDMASSGFSFQRAVTLERKSRKEN